MTSAHPPAQITLDLADPLTEARWTDVMAASRLAAGPGRPEAPTTESQALVLRVSPGLVPAPDTVDALHGAWREDPSRPVAARVLPLDDGSHTCVLGTIGDLRTGAEPRQVPTAVVYACGVRADAEGGPVSLTRPAEVDERCTSGRAPHPAAETSTSIGEVLSRVGATVVEPAGDEASCFLTVVTRTQGRRPQCLAETLLCLAGQTVRDFEVVLVRHRATTEQRTVVDDIVAGQPGWLRDRIRLVDVDTGNRATPLNHGFDAARGRYVAVLDDDDLVFAHWVESFRALEHTHPARILRAAALRLPVRPDRSSGELVAAPTGPCDTPWPTDFSLLDHLLLNYTPCMAVAFPRGVVSRLGLRFDESLDTNEDWDFLVQAASLVGVACTAEYTGIYRWWEDEESSRHEHEDAEWERNHEVVRRRLDDQVLLLPRGSTTRLSHLVGTQGSIDALVARHRATVEDLEQQIRDVHETFATEIAKVHASRRAHMEALEREQAKTEAKTEKIEALRVKLRRHQEAESRRTAELEAALEELETIKTSTAWRAVSRLRRS